jgi:hypothetical protein
MEMYQVPNPTGPLRAFPQKAGLGEIDQEQEI